MLVVGRRRKILLVGQPTILAQADWLDLVLQEHGNEIRYKHVPRMFSDNEPLWLVIPRSFHLAPHHHKPNIFGSGVKTLKIPGSAWGSITIISVVTLIGASWDFKIFPVVVGVWPNMSSYNKHDCRHAYMPDGEHSICVSTPPLAFRSKQLFFGRWM